MNNLFASVLVGVGCAVAGWSHGAQWTSQLGRLAQAPEEVRAVMEGLKGEEAQAFAGRLLRAANTLPLAPAEKNQRIARIAHELVAGSKTADGKAETLITIFTQASAAYLAGIADVLSAGLDIKLNGISQEEFLKIAKTVITRVGEETAGDPDALIRVTMTIATFLRAAGTGLDLEPVLLACLADADLASVVKNVIGAAVKGDYGPMLQANATARSGAGNWFVGRIEAPGEPLLPPVGNQAGWMGTDGGFGGQGIGGTGLGGAGALPYRGQKI